MARVRTSGSLIRAGRPIFGGSKERLSFHQSSIWTYNETKSLSGNQYFGEDELGAGQMNEPQVVLGLLFPTHQEPPRAVQPRMCSLHYPTPGPPATRRVLASPLSLASLLLLGRTYVGLVAPRL